MHENKKYTDYKNKTAIDVDSILKDILRQWWVILLVAISAALLAGSWKKLTYVPQYTASTTFVVGKTGFSNSLAYDNLNSAKEVTTRFSQVANSSVLKKEVCKELGMDSFRGTVSVNVVEASNLMTMKVTANSPEEAYKIIRSVMTNTRKLTSELMSQVAVKTLLEPKVPAGPSRPLDTRGWMKKAGLAAGMLMIALFGTISFFKDTVKNSEEAVQKLDARLLGSLCHEKKFLTRKERRKGKKAALSIESPGRSFAYVEAVKLMTTKLRMSMDRRGAKVLLVTSVSENEGKSTVAANIALALSQEEKRVLLVDCDFRKPSQYKIFEVNKEKHPELDFAQALLKKTAFKIERVGANKQLLALFSMTPHQRLLNNEVSSRLEVMLKNIKTQVDYIILDTSPLALAADGEVLAEMADASILVVQQDVMETKYINDTIDQLNHTKARVLGCVFNNVYQGLFRKTRRYGRYSQYRSKDAYKRKQVKE